MIDAFVGTMLLWAGTYPPRDWAFCNGDLLPIANYQLAFVVLGTTYGGDGRTTFALPDLRGRMPVGTGQAPGLTNRTLGEPVGQESATLSDANIPAHEHTFTASSTANSSSGTPLKDTPATGWTLGAPSWLWSGTRPPSAVKVGMYAGASPTGPVPSAATSTAGSASPAAVGTVSPALGLNVIIRLVGEMPPNP